MICHVHVYIHTVYVFVWLLQISGEDQAASVELSYIKINVNNLIPLLRFEYFHRFLISMHIQNGSQSSQCR